MEIPREIADREGVPEDLDSSVHGPYQIPSTTRRKRAGLYYLGGSVLVLGAVLFTNLPVGLLGMAALLLAVGVYHFVAGWSLNIRDAEALFLANRATDFAVGHASAALGFRGWRSRPVWNVLLFSADNPPSQRGLVRVDAVNGEVIESYVEATPST